MHTENKEHNFKSMNDATIHMQCLFISDYLLNDSWFKNTICFAKENISFAATLNIDKLSFL